MVVWKMCCPAHTGNEVSCVVGGVLRWHCSMCAQCGHVGYAGGMGCGFPVARRHITEN